MKGLTIIFKPLTLSNLNLFKETEKPVHSLVFFFFFFIFVQCWNFKHFEVTPTDILALLKFLRMVATIRKN